MLRDLNGVGVVVSLNPGFGAQRQIIKSRSDCLVAVSFRVTGKPEGTGSIINVASVNGFRAGLGGHYYSAAKAASTHLTHCAAMELGEKGIRVNSLSPGMIATGAFANYVGMQPDEADDHHGICRGRHWFCRNQMATAAVCRPHG